MTIFNIGHVFPVGPVLKCIVLTTKSRVNRNDRVPNHSSCPIMEFYACMHLLHLPNFEYIRYITKNVKTYASGLMLFLKLRKRHVGSSREAFVDI